MTGRKFVIFIDSMGTDDVDHMPYVRDNFSAGSMDARPVYVTPTVLGSVYTGKQPSEHGMPAVSKHGGGARGRPDGITIPEMAAQAEQFESVVQMGLPFIVPPITDGMGDYYHHSGAMGQAATFPDDAGNMISVPTPPGDLSKPDENMDLAYDARIDHCFEAFGRMRNAAIQAEADVVFFGFRIPDSYCHYQYDQPGEETYRDMVLEEVDRQIKHTANLGDVFVFGDHGATSMDMVFRINRWLMSNGYLDVEIDNGWIEKAKEYGQIEEDEDTPGETLSHQSPGVTVNEEDSVAISSDPFSGGVTLLGGASEDSVEEMIADLESRPEIEAVHWSSELWPGGQHLDECPDLYAERVPGTFISGNLHPVRGGAEVTRSGVHHPYGLYGTDTGMEIPNDTTPGGLFSVIAEDFLGLDTDGSFEGGGSDDVDMDDEGVRDHLEDLGYI